MNHCKFRRAVDDQKSHTLGEHKVTWPSEPGRGQGAHILVLKPYSNRGDTISTFLFPSASPQKKFQTFLLLLDPTALGKVSFYYTAYQKTTVFEILIKNIVAGTKSKLFLFYACCSYNNLSRYNGRNSKSIRN